MQDEPTSTRTSRGATLAALAVEDLDAYGVAELEERVDALEAEIARTQAAAARRRHDRSAAEAVFGRSPSAAA